MWRYRGGDKRRLPLKWYLVLVQETSQGLEKVKGLEKVMAKETVLVAEKAQWYRR